MQRLSNTNLSRFQDVEFMTAREKEMVLKQWETFLKGGLQQAHFTGRLYNHLHLHCSFIAHYSREGFYDTYFTQPEATLRFLEQFDMAKGGPAIEYSGSTWWLRGDYQDINTAMIETATKYLPKLKYSLFEADREQDLAKAKALAEKHGFSLVGVVKAD